MTEMRCSGIQRFTDTYLDGEFGERDRVEFEAHLAECESCRHKVKQQASWKFSIKAAAPREQAPASLRNSVARAIAKESARAQTRRWAIRVLPMSAAAGVALMVVASPLMQKLNWAPAVAADVVAKHQRNWPLEIKGGSEQVKQWYVDKIDFPVKPPTFEGASPKHVAFKGGRLTNVRDRQAAYLQYEIDGSKVSVFIFDPSQLPVGALGSKSKRVVGNRDVYFDRENGYNVALFEDRGEGYAIASDLDQDQMVSLVSATVGP